MKAIRRKERPLIGEIYKLEGTQLENDYIVCR
jgi:hypothetical protein